ncbi:TRAP transporter small permease [Rhodobacteraceae bacterium LMO-12]|nr:TRAP transporter small permease [Rhodobacteraceae bacterium LMO-JJ12]
MNGFRRFDALMGHFYYHLGTAVGISIGLFAVTISLDLFLRLFSIGNLPGVQEIIEYVMFAGVFLSAPWALRIGAHVRVDLLIGALPTAWGKRLDQLLNLAGLSICLILLWFGGINLKFAYAFQSMLMKYYTMPEWWLLTVFVVSFALLSLEFISRMLRGGNAFEPGQHSTGGI